jgi:hypothetical protein
MWYGEPCGISYYEQWDIFVLRYPHTLVNVRLNDGEWLSTNAAVDSIHWKDPAFENVMQPDICVDNVTDGVINSGWYGFTSRAYASRRLR